MASAAETEVTSNVQRFHFTHPKSRRQIVFRVRWSKVRVVDFANQKLKWRHLLLLWLVQ